MWRRRRLHRRLRLFGDAYRDVFVSDDVVVGGFDRTELQDAAGERSFVAYEYGAGDTSVGAFFVAGTTEVVAVISDGALERCRAGI